MNLACILLGHKVTAPFAPRARIALYFGHRTLHCERCGAVAFARKRSDG